MTSNYHIDLWEHASKLYHWNHWQQAEDIFEFLATDIGGTKLRTFCLLNKALVEARAGDYSKAALTIARVVEVGEDLPITAFFAGLLHCELSQLTLAEAWFQACLDGLHETDIDYADDGLNFVLEREAVQHNLESASQARLAEELGFDDAAPDDLCYVPAEMLFEAPPRASEASPVVDAAPKPALEPSMRVTEESATVAVAPSKSITVLSRVPSSAYSVASLGQESIAPLICDAILASPDKLSFGHGTPSLTSPTSSRSAARTDFPIVIDLTKAIESPTATPPTPSSLREVRSLERVRLADAAVCANSLVPKNSPQIKIPYTRQGRQQKRYEPRDARGVGDSTKELADFVQEFAPDDCYERRKIRTKDTRDMVVVDGGKESMEREYEKLAIRLGAVPSPKGEGNLLAEQVKLTRAAALEPERQRPTPPRADTVPVRSNSLRRILRSPKPVTAGGGIQRQPSKVRWPFHDDEGIDYEARRASPLPSATRKPLPNRSATLKGSISAPLELKPVRLDFIMGPDGKTRVIEKAPKPAPLVSGTPNGAEELAVPVALQHLVPQRAVPPALRAAASLQSPRQAKEDLSELPLLQPTIYEPPAWRKRKPSPIGPTSPLIPQRPPRTDSLNPVPLDLRRQVTSHQASSPSTSSGPSSPSQGLASCSSPGSRSSRNAPSVVSSINIFDYLLDMVKPGNPKKQGKG